MKSSEKLTESRDAGVGSFKEKGKLKLIESDEKEKVVVGGRNGRRWGGTINPNPNPNPNPKARLNKNSSKIQN